MSNAIEITKDGGETYFRGNGRWAKFARATWKPGRKWYVARGWAGETKASETTIFVGSRGAAAVYAESWILG